MMKLVRLLPILASLPSLALAAGPEMTKPVVKSVSMFKNNFAFVTREIKLKSGVANLVAVPEASLGTLWFWTPKGDLESIRTAESKDQKTTEVPVESFVEALSGNIGKAVEVDAYYAGALREIRGKILVASAQLLVVETDQGSVAVAVNTIQAVSGGAGFTWKKNVVTPQETRYYTIKASKDTDTVMMMSLERGMTWAPGYALDITDPKKMILASKATILNDLVDLDNTPIRLITGFPNLEFKDILDPFTAGMSPDQWMGQLNRAPGGYGGGRGRAADMMTQNAMAPMEKSITWGGDTSGDVGGEQLGDLFFYDIDGFSSKAGSRQYRNLFRFETTYKHIYTWEVGDNVDGSGQYREAAASEPQDVWHKLRFLNNSKRPLTTAVATIFNKGELLGQSMLNFCVSGGEAEATINKALGVHAEASEEETERIRAAIKDRFENPRFDLVTVKGTLLVRNSTDESIQIEISKSLTGEVIASADGKATKTTKGLRQVNPTARIKWERNLKKGESAEIEYVYKLYVPAS